MDSIRVDVNRALFLQDNGQFAEALIVVDSILAQYPGQLNALNIKSEILKAQGKEAESLEVLERAYALQPRDKETAYNLAWEYAETTNAKALSLTDTLLKYDKTETAARAWYIKASYYNNMGKTKEALRYYDSSNMADYNFLDAYLDRGRLLYKQKNYNEALKSFALGQKLAPAAAEFYFWIARVQEAMGDKKDAKMNYERAYSLDKSYTEAKAAAEQL